MKIGVIDEAFESLFFGSGSWLGLLLFLIIITGLLFKWKYAGVLLLPMTIFLGIEYLNEGLKWQCMIMFLSSIFILFYLLTKRR